MKNIDRTTHKSALAQAQGLSIILVVILSVVAFAYIGTSLVDSSQIQSMQNQLNSIESRFGSNVTSIQHNVSSLQGKLSSLPVLNQKPVTRNVLVEWTNALNSKQDRFFLPTITVNQGDTIHITFISNDTDAHTFTLESPYDFQINATVPGTRDFLRNETPFTTNATNNSPGVKVSGTPGNLTATGSFVAKYSGIYEYFCIYHVQLGMFGYLIVLPNSYYSAISNQTTISGQTVSITIPQGTGSNYSSTGFFPSTITVVIGTNDTVTWTNNDIVPHTVTADDGSFSSGNMNPGDTFTFSFTTPGTYQYHCSYHSWMRGTVIVISASV